MLVEGKTKVYKTLVQPVFTYAAETRADMCMAKGQELRSNGQISHYNENSVVALCPVK